MSAKLTANQATKIAPCLYCGAGCTVIDNGKLSVWCDDECGYGGQWFNSNAKAIAAHNALATASARPKDGGAYKDVAGEIDGLYMVAWGMEPRLYSPWDSRRKRTEAIASKLSELMQPRDVAGLEEAVNGCIEGELLGKVQAHIRKFLTRNILAAVRHFCDPETLRQRNALLKACEQALDAIMEPPRPNAMLADGILRAAITKCEATK